ncbi:MAG: cobalamin-dependent protein, partial [Tenericutes bacterium]|nr:cobalamin-dependent protein [Mycoplasmatota bacterium]
EVEWLADGTVVIDLTLPTSIKYAEAASIEIAKKMNLLEPEVIHREVLQTAEATRIQVKGKIDFDIDLEKLVLPEEPDLLSEKEIRDKIDNSPLTIVAGTVGEDEHSVGLREIIDIKHGGIEKYGINCIYLGTSVPITKLVDAAIESNAAAILMSTIISHDDIHYKNMKKIHEYAIEKGVRDKIIIVAGGTQVTPELAKKQGVDQGFGRGTKGNHVASFIVKKREEINEN